VVGLAVTVALLRRKIGGLFLKISLSIRIGKGEEKEAIRIAGVDWSWSWLRPSKVVKSNQSQRQQVVTPSFAGDKSGHPKGDTTRETITWLK
jgi:hypothetical protein